MRWCLMGTAISLLGCGKATIADAPAGGDESGHLWDTAGAGGQDDDGGPLVLGPPLACDAPNAEVSYTEVGRAMGLEGAAVDLGDYTHGGSAAVADMDLDGDLDVVLAFRGGPPVLYSRHGDGFEASVLPTSDEPIGLSLLHADGDGRLDLGIAGGAAVVLLNTEQGWQETVLPLAAADAAPMKTVSVVPGDLNQDGWEDLYMLGSGYSESADGGDYVLLSTGAGTFENASEALPSDLANQNGFDAKWFDWDGDGWLDLYVVNDVTVTGPEALTPGNVLYRNVEGVLQSANASCSCGMQVGGMGVDVADINGDDRVDIYVAASLRNILLEQLVDGSYVDTTLNRAANPVDGTPGAMGWSGIFLDYDNDGFQDILVTEGGMVYPGSTPQMDRDMPIRLMQHIPQDGGFQMRDRAGALGLDLKGFWRAAVAADHNADGVLDLLVTDVVKRPRLFLSDGCTAAGWLRVEGPPGTKIELAAAGRSQTAWISRHSGYLAAKPAAVHFGLGNSDVVTVLKVTKPTGEVLEIPGPIQGRRVVRVP